MSAATELLASKKKNLNQTKNHDGDSNSTDSSTIRKGVPRLEIFKVK